MHAVENYGIGKQKREVLDPGREFYYAVEVRNETRNGTYEYYISVYDKEDRRILKCRVIKSSGDGQDAWIEEYEEQDGLFEITDEILDLIIGLYPGGDEEVPASARGMKINGIPGRYTLEKVDKGGILDDGKVTFTLEKNMFIPDNFYSEMTFDVGSGLMISMSKVDTRGFLSVELKNITKKDKEN